MPRLFSGLEIPGGIAERLALLQGGIPGARWITSQNYHLTLRFIGDVDLTTANSFAEALEEASRPPFTLKITALDAFGNNRPRAIVARAEAHRDLMDLQYQHERIAQRIGLPPLGRKFQPHITLARLRDVRPGAVAEYLTLRGGFTTEPFAVDRFVLFSARDTVGGGPYVAEEVYPLSAPPSARTVNADQANYDGD